MGSDQLVTINELVDIVEGIAGLGLERRYKLDAPQGVRGRNSDHPRRPAGLGAVESSAEDGLAATAPGCTTRWRPPGPHLSRGGAGSTSTVAVPWSWPTRALKRQQRRRDLRRPGAADRGLQAFGVAFLASCWRRACGGR